jgi:hypothetical protein
MLKIKKIKKIKDFSSDEFISEICSVIELVPFIIPCAGSFADYVKNTLVGPYPLLPITKDILDHFEIELDDEDDDSDEYDDNKQDKNIDNVKHTLNQILSSCENKQDAENDQKAMDNKSKNNQMKASSNLQQIKDETSSSRWDCINNNNNNSIVAVAKKTNDTNHAVQEERTTKRKSNQEKPELFSRQEIKIHPTSRNPLLANGRGTYVGRHLSHNFFNQVKVVQSTDVSLKMKQRMEKGFDKIDNPVNGEMKNLENNEKPVHMVGNKNKSSTQTSLIASLGSATPSFRIGSAKLVIGQTKPNLNIDRKRSRIESNNRSCQRESKPPLRRGAAALAARAGLAMRKKTRT